MWMYRFSLATGAVATVAFLAGAWLAESPGMSPAAAAWVHVGRSESQNRPLDVEVALISMRDLHSRTLASLSAEARQALSSERAGLMATSLALMRKMKKDLPTTATGELLTQTITPQQADQVWEFSAIMDLLVQMRDDQEATTQDVRVTGLT